jgi:putative hydrolase of the HAD superfamily
MKYKAVIFDLFGTLVPDMSPAAVEGILRQMCTVLDAPFEEFSRRWRETFEAQMVGRLLGDRITLDHVCGDMGLPLNDVQAAAAAQFWIDKVKDLLSDVRPAAREVLATLRAKGCMIGLVSNSSFETVVQWNDTDLAPLFDATVFSCLEGMMKPDPRIFGLVCQRLGVPPDLCVYVADGIGGELSAASAFGMHAMRIMPFGYEVNPFSEEWNGLVVSTVPEVLDVL